MVHEPHSSGSFEGPHVVLGLLGGIGAGKSHVAKRIASLAPGDVADADLMAREALDACAKDGRLAAALGPGFLTKDGKPDRRAIAKRVFSDPPALRALERLTHPAIQALIGEKVQDHRSGGRGAPPVLVLDVPLLIEVGLDRQCDTLWFVDVPEPLRLSRAEKNGFSADEVRRRETHQAPLDRKRARADLVLRNDVRPEDLDRQILEGLAALGVRPARAAR